MYVQLTFVSVFNTRNVLDPYLEVWCFCNQKYAIEMNPCLYQLAYGKVGFVIHVLLKVVVSKTLLMILTVIWWAKHSIGSQTPGVGLAIISLDNLGKLFYLRFLALRDKLFHSLCFEEFQSVFEPFGDQVSIDGFPVLNSFTFTGVPSVRTLHINHLHRF